MGEVIKKSVSITNLNEGLLQLQNPFLSAA